MPELRTDDAVRRLRGVWLGPDRYRLPVDWTYVEWAGFLACWALIVPAIGFGLWALIGDPITCAVAGILFGSLGAWYARQTVTKLVDGERPVRYWSHLVQVELAAGRPHITRHRYRTPIALAVIVITARLLAALSGRSILVWLALVSVPLWLLVVGALDRRATRRTPGAGPMQDSEVVERLVVPTAGPMPERPAPMAAGIWGVASEESS